jgi:hypothetical protein
MVSCAVKNSDGTFETDYIKFSIDKKARVENILYKKSGQNLVIPNYKVSLISLVHEGKVFPISSWTSNANNLLFKFDKIETEVEVKVETKEQYLSFEIIKINSTKQIDKIKFGPFHVIPSEKIGQSVGLAYDDEVAVGFMGLNLKSRGGFEIKHRERYGNAAKKIEGGAKLSGFVRNRSVERIEDRFEQNMGQTLPVKDGDAKMEGAKFALFSVPSKNLVETVESIVLKENLPYIKTKGVWNKKSRYSSSTKFIMPFNVKNINDCIEVAKRAGITNIYHGWLFKTWGNFLLRENDFPNAYASVRECSDKAEKHGINLGAHTLTNFITPNDSYVTPVPHPNLVLGGVTKLAKTISEDDKEIVLVDKKVRRAYYEPNLHKVNPRWRKHTAVRIGDEIILYTVATKEGELILKDCKRGAFGTKVSKHEKGAKVGRLASHGYKVFFPDINLQDQMAKNLAKVFNEGNLKRISFDGIEGGLVPGHGRYGCDRFVKVFFDNLKDKNIVANSSDVTNYGWHYFANESWGEPWTSKNFREAHLDHRINVQKSLKEDLLPTKMGQFSINDRTTKKDIEWVMGLGAGFDAGVDFYISPDFLKTNKEAEAILAEVKKWEEARMAGLFTEKQQEMLRDPFTFYRLKKNGNKIELIFVESWAPEKKKEKTNAKSSLPHSITDKFEAVKISKDYKHINMTTEPGQPTAAIWKFNSKQKQNLRFVIRLPKKSKESVKGIYIRIGTEKITFPFVLGAGEYILCNELGECAHYSVINEQKGTKKIQPEKLKINKGDNLIEFDYKGKGRVAGPEMLVNFVVKN